MESFSALGNCRSISRVGSTCLPAPRRRETMCYSVCHMYVKSCNCKPCNSAFLLWVRMACREGDHHLFPHASHLWVWLLLFLLVLESIMTSLIFLSVWFEEKGWLDVSTLSRLGLSLAVSVLQPSPSFPLQWHEHYLFPLDAPTYIPRPLVTWWACPLLSRPVLHPGEQLWMGMPELPLWVGQVLTQTQ